MSGAVTWGDGTRGTTGRITRWNSVLGGMALMEVTWSMTSITPTTSWSSDGRWKTW